MTTTPERQGDTTLRNVRVADDLWFPVGEAAKRANPPTDRSKIARDAYQQFLDRENDQVWKEATRLAAARGTTAEAVQHDLLEKWVTRQQRAEAKTQGG